MANFEEALKITLGNEGDYSNDRSDPGGETKYGISKKSYPELDIKNLTLDNAKNIYKKSYWNAIKGDLINDQNIANKLFDLAVNVGCKTAIKFIQRAICDLYFPGDVLEINGVMDDSVLREINNYGDEIKLLNSLKQEAKNYYYSLNNDKYIKGWIKRVNR